MYRYTAVTHSDPTVYAHSLRELLLKIKSWYPINTDYQFKPDDYGEGWFKVEGKTIGYIDQGPLIRG